MPIIPSQLPYNRKSKDYFWEGFLGVNDFNRFWIEADFDQPVHFSFFRSFANLSA